MAYKFYGAETADVKDVLGLTPRDYYDLLTDLGTVETCAPAFRPEWSEENRTLGQCSITAFLVQDHFGGKVLGLPLPDGAVHCFNDVDGCIFDLTSEQFGDEVKDYVHVTEQFREDHFANADKKARYELLKKRLEKKLREVKKLQKQIKRVKQKEALLKEAELLMASFERGEHVPSADEKFRIALIISALEAYYTGPEWKEDFAADEAGKFPKELQRGVLSEDGIDSVLERYREYNQKNTQ